LDRRSTDWRSAEWQALEDSERHSFLIGFSLGWTGAVADESAKTASINTASLSSHRARVAKAARFLPGPRLAAVLLRAQLEVPLPSFTVTGETWLALDPRPRLALLHGVYAGAYARAIDQTLETNATSEELDQAFAEVRRLVKPKLALAPSVLFARLSDWLFYIDRRPAPLVGTISMLAEQIKGP
jgi:hypothetical protein